MERWFGVIEEPEQEHPVYHLVEESFAAQYAANHPEALVMEHES
jgi:hypothetical protein